MIAGGGPEEDWGCAGPDELFITSGPTPSLWSLVQRIESREQLRRIGGKLDPVRTKTNILIIRQIPFNV